jgi:branched-chain amino acid transport system substrate-binding protein
MSRQWNTQSITFNVLALIAAIAVLFSGYFIFDIIQSPQIGDGISAGEEILIKYTGLDKDTEQFQKLKENKQFQAAIKKAKEVAEQNLEHPELCADPEPLIYLNNQQIPPQAEAYTIAVVVPIGNENTRNRALQILRGVAQEQKEFNQTEAKRQGKYLRVIIANEDDDDPKSTKAVANALLSQEEVLGVIGHFSSNATIEANKIYSNKLVAISPSSTSMDINPNGDNQYFFRTVPNNSLQAKLLANYMLKKIKASKVVIIHTDRNFSISLKNEFTKVSEEQGWQVFPYEINKIPNPFEQAETQNVSTIMLAINSLSISDTLLSLPDVEKAQKFKYLGGDPMYEPSILKKYPNIAKKLEGMVIAIPWHHDVASDKSQEFVAQAYKLWCQLKENEEKITWVTATSYDATNVFTEAIENTQNPTRSKIQEYIKKQFHESKNTTGVTGNIRFNDKGDLVYKKGDLEVESRLVQIQEKKEGEKAEYVYKLLPSS